MKIKDILNEGISDILYHCTSFQGAKNILRTNVLGKQDLPISFARSAYGSYHRDNKMIGVIFEINGRRLSHNYAGAPVGGENWLYDPEDYDPADRDTWEFQGKTDQAEDRVTGPIKNFLKYVIRAIVYVPEEYINSSYEDEFGEKYKQSISEILSCIKELESKNIRIQYVSKESQLTKNITKSDNKSTFFKMLSKHDDDFEQQLSPEEQTKTEWIVQGNIAPDGGSDDITDYEGFDIKFLAPLSTPKQKLIQLAANAIKSKYPDAQPKAIFISYIESLKDYRKSFDVDLEI